MSSNTTKLAIVIPTYNEAPNIRRIVPILRSQYKATVIIVDDKSKDGTSVVARENGALVPYHGKRLGLGRSLKEGLIFAFYTLNADLILQMDADHPIEEIGKFLQAIKNYHVVKGSEVRNYMEWKFARKFACKMVLNVLRINRNLTHPTCGFTLWRKDVLENIPWSEVRSNGDAIHIELLFWANRLGAKVGEVQFVGHHGERYYGLMRAWSWWRCFWRYVRIKYIWFWRSFV